MLLNILKSKIKELVVTESNILYPGSISIPQDIMLAANIHEFELVHVNNKTNGNRIITYAVQNKNKGVVTLNGAASKHFKKGDIIHVMTYALLNKKERLTFNPILVLCNSQNQKTDAKPYVFE
jgi:aspartate 1-decarboxylase